MKNKEELISVIVPVYNVEKYVEKCVNSILEQTYDNFELILINDGSTDNSLEVINRLKEKDKRIIIIDKKNGGVSSARNSGMKIARGEYLLFIDSDDYLENDYIEYFYYLITRDNGYDVGINYNKFNIYTPEQVAKEKVEIIPSDKAMEFIYTGEINVAVWNKIFKSSFLKNHSINFNEEIWYGEGMLFNIQCLQYTDKVIAGNKRVYHQFFNQNSAMRDFNLKSNLCGLESLELQKKCWKNASKNVKRAWEFHKWCFNMSILKGIIKTNSKSKYHDEYNYSKKMLRKGWYMPLKAKVAPLRRCFYLFSAFFPELGAKIFLYNEKKHALKMKS